ncbi:MAG TPA: hypothetical protein VN150_09865, partial [Ochrobactrum sp.]|nr:hypothetical protein [Ochrobactrum sp.]
MQRLNYDKANPPLYERGVIRAGVDERFNHGTLLFLLRSDVNTSGLNLRFESRPTQMLFQTSNSKNPL